MARRKAQPEILDTKPPADGDAERALLGSMLLKPGMMSKLVEDGLRSGDFDDEVNRTLWDNAYAMHVEGKPVDYKLLVSRLRDRGDKLADGARVLVGQLWRDPPITANAPYYLQRVREVSAKRQLRFLGEKLLRDSSNGEAVAVSASEAIAMLRGFEDKPAIKPNGFGELLRDNPQLHPPVIHGLLRRGETANLISISKAGKSWLSYSLTLSIVLGRDFLGAFECERGRVLLIDNELHKPTIAYRIKTVCHAMGARIEDISDGCRLFHSAGD
jgi:hypothetical protein